MSVKVLPFLPTLASEQKTTIISECPLFRSGWEKKDNFVLLCHKRSCLLPLGCRGVTGKRLFRACVPLPSRSTLCPGNIAQQWLKGRGEKYKEYATVKILVGKLTAVSLLKFPTLLWRMILFSSSSDPDWETWNFFPPPAVRPTPWHRKLLGKR